MRAERARGRERVGPTRAYPDQAIVGLDDIARAGDDEGDLGVGHCEERLQAAEDAVHPPVLGELDGGARQIPAMLLELGLELREQREGIRGGAGKARQHPPAIDLPHLARPRLDDRLPDRDLTRSEEHTSELSHSQISYAVLCLEKNNIDIEAAVQSSHR